MRDLFRAFFYKIRKDLTFRITLIVGAGLAILMTLLYLLIDSGLGIGGHLLCTGNNLFLVSFNPAQNFGIAIPINLITFTVLEFTHGIIRNKIVAGNSKVKIYISLFLTGLVYTLSLLFTYVGLCTLLGTIIGKFDPNGFAMVGMSGYGIITPDFIWRFFVSAILVYITITAATIFISTLLRNIGPSIPIAIVVPILLCTIVPVIYQIPEVAEALGDLPYFLNPFQNLSASEAFHSSAGYNLYISDKAMWGALVSNLLWSAIFVGFGTLIFVKRDVK